MHNSLFRHICSSSTVCMESTAEEIQSCKTKVLISGVCCILKAADFRLKCLIRCTLWSHRPESMGNVNYDITQNHTSSKMFKTLFTFVICTNTFNFNKNYIFVRFCSQISPTMLNSSNLLMVMHLSIRSHTIIFLRILCVVRGGSINFITWENALN